MTTTTSLLSKLSLLAGAGALSLGLGCGVPIEEETGVLESALLSTTVLTPIQGECTTVKTLDKVETSPGVFVIRGTCSEKCKKKANEMGIWNLSVTGPNGTTSAPQNLGPASSNQTRAAQVDVPYVPGSYNVGCTDEWQEKVGSTHFFGSGGTFVGGTF